ncbi:MAG: hypothetical protein Kow0090_10410 [Myxococcota bacterium]
MELNGARIIIAVVFFAALIPAGARGEEGGRLSLEEALRLAGERNLDILISAESIRDAEAGRKAIRGNFGPKFILDAGVQYWNKEIVLDFSESMGGAPQGAPPQFDPSSIDTSAYPAAFQPYIEQMSADFGSAMGSYMGELMQWYLSPLLSAEPMVVRERLTSSLRLNVVQPLSMLYQVYQGHKAATVGEEAARMDKDVTVRNVELEVVSAYFGLLAALKGVEIAQASVKLVEEHRANAERFYNAGLISRNELLQAEIGLAEAKQKQIQARSGAAMARSNLNRIIGVHQDEMTIPIDPFSEKPPAFSLSVDECIERGVASRLELRSLDKRIEQVEAAKKIAYADMLPQLSAIFSYSHNEGSTFQDPNEYFVGATLSWTLWEWGATYYKIDSAGSKRAQIDLRKQQLVEGLSLQIRKSYLDLRAAEESLAVSEAQVAQAEENFRIISEKFQAGAATSTDVLEAETKLTAAKSGRSATYYSYLISRATLNNAIGERDTLSR